MGHSPGKIVYQVTKQVSINFKKTEITSSIFSDYNGMKLENSQGRLNNILLNNGSNQKKNYLEKGKNENMIYQNLWDAAKAVKGKFIVINAYMKKKISHINNLTLHFKELEKEQTKLKVGRRKEGKIRTEIKHQKDNRKH